MVEIPKEIEEIENQIEEALWSLEMRDEKEKALEIYLEAESKLDALAITMEKSAYYEQQRVLSYCLILQPHLWWVIVMGNFCGQDHPSAPVMAAAGLLSPGPAPARPGQPQLHRTGWQGHDHF